MDQLKNRLQKLHPKFEGAKIGKFVSALENLGVEINDIQDLLNNDSELVSEFEHFTSSNEPEENFKSGRLTSSSSMVELKTVTQIVLLIYPLLLIKMFI